MHKLKNKGITFTHDRGTEIENQIPILSWIKFHKKERNCKNKYKDFHYVEDSKCVKNTHGYLQGLFINY